MPGSTRIDELRQKFHENPRRYFAPLANEYRKAGDPEQAIAICRAHLAQQPGHMSGHVVYGQALYDARRTEEARSVFEKALALDPDNAIVLRQLGDIAREKGDTDEAKHWYSRALDADPHDKEIAAYIAELTEPLTTNAEVVPADVAAEAEETVTATAEPEAEATTAAPTNVVEEAPEPEPIEVAPEEVPAPITPAIAPQEIEMVSEVAAPLEPDREIEIAPSPEPEIEQEAEESEVVPAAVEDDVAWRKTPPHEESPFVTRTMAELYAKQGYREAALDVYRQLALHHPDDKEIFDRIEALEKDSAAETPSAPPPKPNLSELPFEPIISDIASEPEPEVVRDYSERAVYGAEPDPDAEFTPRPPGSSAPHFTELEIGGDTWDTDAWGAGFTGNDEIDAEFVSPDVPEQVAGIPPQPEPETVTEPVEEKVAQLDPQPVEVEAEAEAEPEAEPEVPPQPEPEPEPEPVAVAPEPEPEPEPESEPEPVAAYAEPERESVEAHEPAFVAYAPQPPADEELPHFAPKGPTVREFFAALGAFRPSARAGSSITAHAALTPMAPEAEEDLPLATDAFANLFGESPVSDEDSRAAFALSGALGGSQPAPTPTPAKPAPAVEAAAPAPATQESEEDIRRFREWLDGLAET